MTAPAAAPASAPIAPAAPRAAIHPPADHFAFAAVLNSLPNAAAKTSPSVADEHSHPSNRPPQEDLPDGRPAHHGLPNDGAALASLPFALRAASMMKERPQSADDARSLPTPAMKGQSSEAGGATTAAGSKAAAVGRLIGERAFHFGASAGVIANRAFPIDAAFARGAASFEAQSDRAGESELFASSPQTEAMPAGALAAAAPAGDAASVPAPIAPRSSAHPTSRVGSARAAPHETARSGQKLEGSEPVAAAQVANSAAPVAPAESSAKATDGRLPNSTTFAAPSTAQAGGPFGAQPPGPFVAGAAFGPDASKAGATDADAAPRASAVAVSSAPSTAPIKEIDVDLSPGGLEDVSMTMRLSGDKLSVVIRAASSQTLGSIEGARDAIADRMAAIGQPLELAHCQTDGRQHRWECERKRDFR